MNIKETAAKYGEYIVKMRRIFHENPEPSTKEYETSRVVREELDKMGVPYVMCGLETGVLATIEGARPGKCILLRADMDALTVNEENDLPFKSKNPGVMHACGHDGHTATLLTVAAILKDIKDELCGTVKLAFQPAEEVGLGADSMIEHGAMEGVDGVFGVHIWSGVSSGYATVQAGPRMASAARFAVKIQGKGGHGAVPEECIDAVTCTAAIVNSLQTLVSREFRPMDTVVCTIGTINAGTRWNVIADSGEITGTTRCFNSTVYEEFPERIERIAKGIGEAYRCKIDVEYENLVKPCINHPAMAELCQGSVKKIFGEDGHKEFDLTPTGEDFASFIEAAPDKMGAIAFVGIGNEAADSCHSHHSPKFKIDEAALLNSACLYCQVAVDFLNS